METKPTIADLDKPKTDPKFAFSFAQKINFVYSERWERSIINMLSDSFNISIESNQGPTSKRLSYGPLEIEY